VVNAQTLEERFNTEMFNLYRRTKAEVYNPGQFLLSLYDRGGLGVARWYINDKTITSGFMRLLDAGRVDLTVEAWIIDHPVWHPLFTEDELNKARRRLVAYGYLERSNQ
jgi:hypothetical protein